MNNLNHGLWALAVGALVMVVGEVGTLVLLRCLHMTWTGDVFGGGPFNWYDSAYMMVVVLLFFGVAFTQTHRFLTRRDARRSAANDSTSEENAPPKISRGG